MERLPRSVFCCKVRIVKKSELFFSVLSVPVDWLMVVVAGVVTYFLRTRIVSAFRPVLFEFNLPFERYLLLVLGVAFLFILIFALAGLYRLQSTRRAVEEFSRIVIASSATTMLLIVYIFLRQELFDSRFLVLGGWLMVIVFVSIGRALLNWLQNMLLRRYQFGAHRVLIIGADETAYKLITGIKENIYFGYQIVKQLANPEISEIKSSIGNPGVDEVILADPNFPAAKVVELVDFCHENHLAFRFVPNMHQTLTKNFAIDTVRGLPLIELRRTNLEGWDRVYKRAVDVLGASVLLVLLLPLFLVIAFAIKWETAGPVFVRLRRVSKNREFVLLKFRSMVENAEALKPFLEQFNERKGSPLFKMHNDPRVTKVGKFIRRYRLDELPQFINVWRGDISLVGPRPHQPDEIAKYEKHHKKVLSIKAGVTGLAQISGSSALPFEEEVALDSFYIENWSLGQDIKIILKTAFRMLLDRSAV